MRTGPNGELLSNNGKQLDFNKSIYDEKFDKSIIASLLQRIYYNPANAQQEITQWIMQSPDRREESSPEQIQDLEKELGTKGTSVNEQDTKDTSIPEQARELWNIFHNDDALKSMKRGTSDEL